MRNLVRLSKTAAVLAAALAASGADAADAPMLAGCYERVYDAAHLAQHPGQLVIRATLLTAPDTFGHQTDKANPIIASGVLKIWVRGRPQSFNTIGACWAQGEGLLCNGSLSAAEAPTCKSAGDGVRQCRIDGGDAGSFKIERKPDGVLVSIRERLELVPAPYDGGPYLYFSPTNPENHAFLLTRKPPEICK
jgi:hypothetical protein